jgi:ATP-dependent DNA helicase DinG
MSLTYVALDLETTGLDAARDAIIEIGAVKFDDRRELGTFGSLVNPGRAIPLKVAQLTGITDHDVMTAPPFAALCSKLLRFVGDAIVVGHNIGFDLKFLRQQKCLAQNAFIDTFELATILMPHESRYSLGKLMDSLGIRFATRHRALDDARASMRLFQSLQERAANLPLRTLRAINRAGRNSRWHLGRVFQEAERLQARGGAGNSIGAQLRAKGLLSPDRPLFVRPKPEELLVPVDERVALDVGALTAMLEKGGALDEVFPGFEYRPQQVEMLQSVAQAFNQSRHLMVEAETGVGKSIAYLLPAIYWAVQNGERVVISTNTINLQDQLYRKDIPDLRKLLPFEVRAAVLKGRSNYLCMRRLEALQSRRDLNADELRVLSKILVWVPHTVTGDRAELFLPGHREQQVWSTVSADTHTCTAERCIHRRQGRCFFYAAHQAAENAHMIIVNHALLLSDVATENRVLPPYHYLIVDEAHHLEDATTHQLGYAVTCREVQSLVTQIGRRTGSSEGFLGSVLTLCRGRVPGESMSDLEDSVTVLRDANERLIVVLQALFDDLAAFIAEQGGSRGQYDYRVRLTHALRIQPDWTQIEMAWEVFAAEVRDVIAELTHVIEILGDLQHAQIPGYDDMLQEGIGLSSRLEALYQQMEMVLIQPQADQITWLRTHAKADELSLCAAPLRVGHLVEQHLLWPKEAAIFTSATLRTNGDFDFIRERLGAQDAEELAVGSPFDYESQVLLYLPTDVPEPNQPYHQKIINRGLIALARATQGRMLVLFTSYSQLQTTDSAISAPLAKTGITVLAQGQGVSRSQLLENFRTTPKCILLGTRSFWEGIDVPGEALSCLVVAKLPFSVPTDPIFAARSESMEEPFYQYAVPEAILRFRQGFGRLIRTKTDRGVVVVFDRRLQTKQYGEMFLRSLPPCTTVRGPLAELPRRAAEWIERGLVVSEATEPEFDDDELEYVPIDDL